MIYESVGDETPKPRFGNFMPPGHTVSPSRTLARFASTPWGEVGLAAIRAFADDAERYEVMGRDLGALGAYIRARARTRARSAA